MTKDEEWNQFIKDCEKEKKVQYNDFELLTWEECDELFGCNQDPKKYLELGE